MMMRQRRCFLGLIKLVIMIRLQRATNAEMRCTYVKCMYTLSAEVKRLTIAQVLSCLASNSKRKKFLV